MMKDLSDLAVPPVTKSLLQGLVQMRRGKSYGERFGALANLEGTWDTDVATRPEDVQQVSCMAFPGEEIAPRIILVNVNCGRSDEQRETCPVPSEESDRPMVSDEPRVREHNHRQPEEPDHPPPGRCPTLDEENDVCEKSSQGNHDPQQGKQSRHIVGPTKCHQRVFREAQAVCLEHVEVENFLQTDHVWLKRSNPLDLQYSILTSIVHPDVQREHTDATDKARIFLHVLRQDLAAFQSGF
mmetsp:Transcript_32116/g.70304  ORF Transcript_32116/g.70304 Transcript_32116/m.70304 type:complete len:241 (-) Transcript_32116:575-1297(-)